MTNKQSFEKDINVPSKQIIINGVDVSECEAYSKYREGYCGWYTPCILENCQYKVNWALKQLKAKEQECEELKGRLQQCWKVEYSFVEQLDQLKAENEELKVMFKDLSYENQKFSYQIEEQTKQLEPFKDEYFKGLETIVIAELAKKSIRITAENRKLEQALTEIKEIADGLYMTDLLDKDCIDCDEKLSLILKKCEVINE